jgi:High potential iron-sulfur protein
MRSHIVERARSADAGNRSTVSRAFVDRRDFLTCLVLGSACVFLPRGAPAQAAELPRLDPADPAAKALAYTESASKLDVKAEPLFKAGNHCGNCKLFQAAQAKGDYAPCLIFPGKSVNTNGWCRVWAAKT